MLNPSVKRNQDRFSSEFMFRMTKKEKQEVVTICDHLEKLKFSPNLPQVFTEYGVVMAANVLNSNRAIEISKIVVKTFIKLREMLVNHRTLAIKLSELESRLQDHDGHIQSLFEAIRQLMVPPESKSTRIGFITDRGK